MVRSYRSGQSQLSRDTTRSSSSNVYDAARTKALSKHSEQPPLTYYDRGSIAHHHHSDMSVRLLEYPSVKQNRPPTGSLCSNSSRTLTRGGSARDPRFEVLQSRHEVYASDGTPSTPAAFAKLFPSTGKLSIHHDDTTSDGNMNLRVDSEVSGSRGRPQKLILFYLRMHDLKDRRFRMKRHGRDSTHEVAASTRRDMAARTSTDTHTSGKAIELVFTNGNPVTVEPRGSKSSRRYEYRLLGTKYEWKRQVQSYGHSEEVSYHLIKQKTSESIAHITPKPLTARESREEDGLGSWVPPCTMRISNLSALRGRADIAESIVATGLIALVDDCIERKWHDKRRFHLDLPLPNRASGLGPEQLIDEIFNRSPRSSRHERLQIC